MSSLSNGAPGRQRWPTGQQQSVHTRLRRRRRRLLLLEAAGRHTDTCGLGSLHDPWRWHNSSSSCRAGERAGALGPLDRLAWGRIGTRTAGQEALLVPKVNRCCDEGQAAAPTLPRTGIQIVHHARGQRSRNRAARIRPLLPQAPGSLPDSEHRDRERRFAAIMSSLPTSHILVATAAQPLIVIERSIAQDVFDQLHGGRNGQRGGQRGEVVVRVPDGSAERVADLFKRGSAAAEFPAALSRLQRELERHLPGSAVTLESLSCRKGPCAQPSDNGCPFQAILKGGYRRRDKKCSLSICGQFYQAGQGQLSFEVSEAKNPPHGLGPGQAAAQPPPPRGLFHSILSRVGGAVFELGDTSGWAACE
jgi:hypothetical protein